MTPAQLAKKLEKQRRDLLIYTKVTWPTKAGKHTLQWIDDNFKAQGYRDNVLIEWRQLKKQPKGIAGTILDRTHKLRNSIKMKEMDGAFKVYTYNKYAKVHNQGFKGWQTVRQHNRKGSFKGNFSAGGKDIDYGASYSLKTRKRLKDKLVTKWESTVYAHSRKVNIPRRQFMPDDKRGSASLMKELKEMTQKDINKILKNIR